jgi:hypothetical protein
VPKSKMLNRLILLCICLAIPQPVRTIFAKNLYDNPRASFLMPNLTLLINAFFENLMNGRNPNEVMFNTSGCFDTDPYCGGWGHVVAKMNAEEFFTNSA